MINRPAELAWRWLLRQATVLLATAVDVRAALALASSAGRLRQRLTGRPSADELRRRLASRLPASADLRAMARETAASEARNMAVKAVILARGRQAIDALIVRPDLEALHRASAGGAVIFVVMHAGPVSAFSTIFRLAGVEAFALVRKIDLRSGARPDIAEATGGADSSAQVLWAGMRRLKRGRPVVLAADGSIGTRLPPVEVAGQSMVWARGAFALARLSGAPLVPLLAYWDGPARIRLAVGPAWSTSAAGTAAPTEVEHAGARALADWFDRELASRPDQSQIRRRQVRLARRRSRRVRPPAP